MEERKKRDLDKLIRSKWIDDLTDEEMKVLYHTHAIDQQMHDIDRDIQRRRFIGDTQRQIIDNELVRQLIEPADIRGIIEFNPEHAIKIRKKKLVV